MRPGGFTLIELLVVVTILGMVIAMLLPAIQGARESARRAHCSNNMRQLALATIGYHNCSEVFPPSITAMSSADAVLANGNDAVLGAGWGIAVLPFADHQAAYEAFDLSTSLTDSATSGKNYSARGAVLDVMLCPTDRYTNQVVKCSHNGGNWARGNYAANGGLCSVAEPAWGDRRWCGVMGWNVACSLDNLWDGAAHTILLLEIRAGLNAQDRRGSWALGLAGASSCWQQADGGAKQPNPCNGSAPFDDSLRDCQSVVGASHASRADCMLCDSSTNTANQDRAATRSLHPGGVNVAFCDGSVHFISDAIETGNYSISGAFDEANCLTWQRLNLSRDGLSVDGSKF